MCRYTGWDIPALKSLQILVLEHFTPYQNTPAVSMRLRTPHDTTARVRKASYWICSQLLSKLGFELQIPHDLTCDQIRDNAVRRLRQTTSAMAQPYATRTSSYMYIANSPKLIVFLSLGKHRAKTYGEMAIQPRCFLFRHKMEASGRLDAPATLLPSKKPRYRLERRLGGPQSRSERSWASCESSPGLKLTLYFFAACVGCLLRLTFLVHRFLSSDDGSAKFLRNIDSYKSHTA
jgi:hypothetical protein